jgi:hypothetical protein
MTIELNRVTRTSQIVAVLLFVGVFALGFWLGSQYQLHSFMNALEDPAVTAPFNANIETDVKAKMDADAGVPESE